MVWRRREAAFLLFAVSAVILCITALAGGHGSGQVRNGGARGGDGSSRIQAEPTGGATATRWWSQSVVHQDRRREMPANTVAGLVQFVPVVADVHVVDIGPTLFNTDAGEAPTPDPGEPDFGLQLGSVVVLDVDEAYMGVEAGTAGFVVWQWGGSVEGLTEEAVPPLVFMSDSEGTAFLMPFTEEDVTNAVAYMKLMANVAAERSQPGAEYHPADLVNFYEHVGDVALSALEGDGPYDAYRPAEVTLAEFMQELLGALSTPTP